MSIASLPDIASPSDMVTPPNLVTLDQFLLIPQDETDRELIRGEIRERPMTKRNRFHAKTEANLAWLVRSWVANQASPTGEVYSGEVGCILSRNPDTNVGIDVAYFAMDTVASQSDATTMIDGAPILAIEILSPSDQQSDIAEKVAVYLEAGVKLVWIVDPHFRTVTFHREQLPPVLFNVNQSITEEPVLSGLKIKVAEIFA